MNSEHKVEQSMPEREKEFSRLEAIVGSALSRAKAGGAEQAEITASVQGGLSTTIRLGEIETIEHHHDRGLSVTVFVGRSKGNASTGDLREEAIDACLSRALDIARFTEADRCNGLAESALMAKEFPDLDLWHPAPLEAESLIERCQAMESAGRESSLISNSEGASASASFGQTVYGNSHGFLGRSDGTRFGQSCILIAGEGDGMQRDYWYDSQRRFGDLESPEETGAKAAERTVKRLAARKIPTCEAPVLFAPEIARTLLGHFIGGISGGALYRNASFLKDSLDTRLFPEWLSIREQPHLPMGPGSSNFDAEGVATRQRAIVEAGVLQGYVLSSYSARRLGLETTGNAGGVHNLCIDGPETPAADLIKQVGTGLLVTEVMGQGVQMVTGAYSRGAAGFWIEDGALAYPVEEITIASNLRDMFLDIQAIGDDVDRRGNLQCGSMLLGNLTIAGS